MLNLSSCHFIIITTAIRTIHHYGNMHCAAVIYTTFHDLSRLPLLKNKTSKKFEISFYFIGFLIL